MNKEESIEKRITLIYPEACKIQPLPSVPKEPKKIKPVLVSLRIHREACYIPSTPKYAAKQIQSVLPCLFVK